MLRKLSTFSIFLSCLLSVKVCAHIEQTTEDEEVGLTLDDLVNASKTYTEESQSIFEDLEIAEEIKPTQPLKATNECGRSPRASRGVIRHIESNGIGYGQGYTTFETFFNAVNPVYENWLPFLDTRVHVFNGGQPAVNIGIGTRYLGSRIWGGNIYYDYRKTNKLHYNQIAFGFESLGRAWDYRLNVYVPVGKKASAYSTPKFDEFEDHYAILTQKREVVMKGFNAEAGYHFDRYPRSPMYFAGGPYYLTGKGKTAWGGQLRAAIDLYDHWRLEANTSYDHVFKWIGQAQVSVVIPFGGKRRIKQSPDMTCGKALALSQRAVQRVDRFEIIPVTKKHKHTKATDPSTGQPYVFWFVDNTSHSNGTFESPFNTLAAAQSASAPNDVIYVFPGDGTTTGMSTGITLKNNQKFFGAGIDQGLNTTLGHIIIPHQAASNPFITNTNAGVSTVTLANGNEASGFTITSNGGNGIQGTDILTASVHNNILRDFTPAQGAIYFNENAPQGNGMVTVQNNTITGITGIGIFFNNPDGTFIVDNNTVSSTNEGISFLATTGTAIATNNRLSGDSSDSGAIYFNQSNGIFTANNNTISTSNIALTDGIRVSGNGQTAALVTIQNNTISNALHGVLINPPTGAIVNSFIEGNTTATTNNAGIKISGAGSGGELDFCIVNNNVSDANKTNTANECPIDIITNAGYNSCGTIRGNHIVNTSTDRSMRVDTSGSISVEVTDNISTGTGTGFRAQSNGGSAIFCIGLKNNSDNHGFSLNNAGGTFKAESPTPTVADGLAGIQSQNTGTVTPGGSITYVAPATCECSTDCQ